MLLVVIKIIISLFLAYLSGRCLLWCLSSKEKHKGVVIPLSIGFVIIVQILFCLSLLKIRFDFVVLNSLLLIFIVLVTIFKKKTVRELLQFNIKYKLKRPRKLIYYILIFLILFQIVFVITESTLRPVYAYDGLANWAWKVKVFSQDGSIQLDTNEHYYLGQDHRNYPLFVPLLGTWMVFASGSLIELLPMLSALFFVLILGFLFSQLRKEISLIKSLALTLVVASSPLLVYHSFNYYADLIFSFYILAAVVCFYRYLKERNVLFWQLGALFAGVMTMVKNTGLFFSIIIWILILLSLWLHKIKFNPKQIIGVVMYLFLVLPWSIFKAVRGLGYSNSSEGSFLDFSNLHFDALKYYSYHLFMFFDFLIWPVIFIGLIVLFIVFRIKKIRDVRLFPVVTTFLFIAAYIFIYIFTDAYNYLTDGTVDGRNLLAIWPLTVFVIGLILSNKKS